MFMREIFVRELVRNVLGPKNGPTEEIRSNPLYEYITGILAPSNAKDDDQPGILPEEYTSAVHHDDQYDADAVGMHPTDPALNPRATPSTMGLSFFTESADPQFQVCVTWARYVATRDGIWTRIRFCDIFDVGGSKNMPARQLNSESEDRILFHYNAERGADKSETTRVSMFVENQMRAGVGALRAERYVFQPQIRVICAGDTKMVEGFKVPNSGDAEAALIYHDRPFLAKGHLTSAVWREIDPETDHDGRHVDSEAASHPPFRWTDGDSLPESVRAKFSPPDVRTEYVPMCSVPSPDLDWADADGSPVLDAEKLAEMYDPDILAEAVRPVVDGYGSWIDRMEKETARLQGRLRKAGQGMVNDCRGIHRRMLAGMAVLRNNDNARLAFCFANRTMHLQRLWTAGEGMRYRPFQLAFVLVTLESVINGDSDDRDVCDLLWVPTGAGKTEAYLAVVATVLAYRRLVHGGSPSGAGVSVITRYTLRLLTIQQFRRTLLVTSAAERLRVEGLDSGGPAGWRPATCPRTDHFLWGSVPFSSGLWVGTSLAPNRLLTKRWRDSNGRFQAAYGAVDLLKTPDNAGDTSGEPAQITQCPACSGLLAVPEAGLEAGDHTIHFVMHSAKTIPDGPLTVEGLALDEMDVAGVKCVGHREPGFYTVSISVGCDSAVGPHEIDRLWLSFRRILDPQGTKVSLCPASARRPGYFLRYVTKPGGSRDHYDFDIFCPNPDCPLKARWTGGSPRGRIHDRSTHETAETLPDGMVPEDVIAPFRDASSHISDRVPIRAFTVDDQVYGQAPSVVVATVDKFARLPYEPRTASLFGNVSYHHHMWGYSRAPHDSGGSCRIRSLPRPDMIIQDELHLIDGPLGSMVGSYESAVDFLSSGRGPPIKYVASTATINKPGDHVRSILNRRSALFPPVGMNGDRFFVRERRSHPIDDDGPGRLYVGVCCPGRDQVTPIARLWAVLSQTAYDHRNNPDIDRFWTLTGYFNSVRELAGARAMYRQDIREVMDKISDNPRPLDLDSSIELSSRTGSAHLPSVLNRLNKPYPPDSPDGLFTTSMFGTGVDIPRIGLMLVNGQPKTTTSYIQSTGRVGRRNGALAVTFFRTSRPRDLNHYEFFARHHLQLHRFVEPVTAHPFASGMLDRVLGPVALGILRNMRTQNTDWGGKDATVITNNRNAPELARIEEYLASRAKNQPATRRPPPESIHENLNLGWDRWEAMAQDDAGMVFVDYSGKKDTVVLGDQQHRRSSMVFGEAPRSLRELEDEVGFGA